MDGASRRYQWAGYDSQLRGQEWIDSGRKDNCTSAITPTEWCNGVAELEVDQLIEENVGKADTVIYMDDFVHPAGQGFALTIMGEVTAE